MARLHHETPPAPLELGWFVLCLPARDVHASIAFYERLGLTLTGGQPEHGWAVLSGEDAEFTPMLGLDAPLLNFRGGDTPTLAELMRSRGLTVGSQNLYDSEKWPAALHTDEHGSMLPAQGSGDFSLTDPDGHALYFDTVPVERAWHVAGQRRSVPEMPKRAGGLPELGRFSCALRCTNLRAAAEFYERVGLSLLTDRVEDGVVRVGYADAPERCTLSLYEHLPVPRAVLFHGADVAALAHALPLRDLSPEPRDGPEGGPALWLTDPGGTSVIFSSDEL